MNKNEELNIVTEVGVFGELDINDPTKKKVKNKDEIQKMIEESIMENAKITER